MKHSRLTSLSLALLLVPLGAAQADRGFFATPLIEPAADSRTLDVLPASADADAVVQTFAPGTASFVSGSFRLDSQGMISFDLRDLSPESGTLFLLIHQATDTDASGGFDAVFASDALPFSRGMARARFRNVIPDGLVIQDPIVTVILDAEDTDAGVLGALDASDTVVAVSGISIESRPVGRPDGQLPRPEGRSL